MSNGGARWITYEMMKRHITHMVAEVWGDAYERACVLVDCFDYKRKREKELEVFHVLIMGVLKDLEEHWRTHIPYPRGYQKEESSETRPFVFPAS